MTQTFVKIAQGVCRYSIASEVMYFDFKLLLYLHSFLHSEVQKSLATYC